MDFEVTITPERGTRLKGSRDRPVEDSGLTFEPSKEEIVFGREPTSDVVFAPDDRLVGRKHFQLCRQPSGDYAVEVFGQRYVAINGTPATTGETVKDGDVIQLGDKSGPSLRVGLKEVAAAGGLAKTMTQLVPTSMRTHMRRVQVGLAGLAVVVIAGGVTAFVYFSGRIDSLEALQSEIQETVGRDFDQALVQEILASTHAVVLEATDGSRTLLGTAWPVGDGWVATNAHVAKGFESRGARRYLLVAPNGTEVYPVTEAWIHPGYAAFNDFRATEARSDPDFTTTFAGLPQPSGFDVALLKVDSPDFAEGLEIASPDDVRDLGPGAKLAYVGYPVEGTATQRAAADNPEPQVKFGYASSVTDFFLFKPDSDRGYLIRHTIPATGGASGSPIFTPDGKVVAILSGGTVFDAGGGVRQPSAVLENFAQRVDLLESRTVGFDADEQVAYWRDEVLPRFGRHRQQVFEDAKTVLMEASLGATVEEAARLSASLGGADAVSAGTVAYVDHEVAVEAGRRYALVAYGAPGRVLSLRLFQDDEAIDFGGSGGSFATIDHLAEADGVLTLRVLGESNNPIDYELVVMTADGGATAAVN